MGTQSKRKNSGSRLGVQLKLGLLRNRLVEFVGQMYELSATSMNNEVSRCDRTMSPDSNRTPRLSRTSVVCKYR